MRLWEDVGVEDLIIEALKVEKVGGERACEERVFIVDFDDDLSAGA